MADFLRVKHSFNSGDLVTLLPGLKHIYDLKGLKTILYQRLNLPAYYYEGATHPITHEGQPVCMNAAQWYRIKALLEYQEYIEQAEIWEGQDVDWDIDLSRDSKSIPMPAGLIHQWPVSIFPELSCDLSKKWIQVNENPDTHHLVWDQLIVIGRTERYTNPYITYFFLKQYEDFLIFSGTESERFKFNKEWGLSIPKLLDTDFLHLASLISKCKGYVGNQSLGWHFADSLKVPRILELCPQFPNTFVTGANGHQFYHQQALEFYFKQLIES